MVSSKTKYQTIRGWGGCFNEKGWEALSKLPAPAQNQVLDQLFDPKDGCRFNLCRLPIGQSDYTVNDSYYAYDEVDGDYDLTHFSISRDKQRLIPFVKAAMERQPNLQVWASPWAPPKWLMEVKPGNKARLKMDDRSLHTYAEYFVKYVRAYQAEGIHLFAVMPQNEPCWDPWKPKHPTNCGFPPDDWFRWVSVLTQVFHDGQVPCQVWLGTLLPKGNKDDFYINKADYVDRVLSDPTLAQRISGVGVQYGASLMRDIYRSYPSLELMQTETSCGNASNDQKYGESQFSDVVGYLNNGAGAYMLWNMVLDNTGASNENWKQSAPVTIDVDQQKVHYNPQFYAYKHFSSYVDPGAVRISVNLPRNLQGDAFLNPDGTRVLVLQNSADSPNIANINFDGQQITPELPAHSWNSFTVKL